jgi:hypothetical protein
VKVISRRRDAPQDYLLRSSTEEDDARDRDAVSRLRVISAEAWHGNINEDGSKLVAGVGLLCTR